MSSKGGSGSNFDADLKFREKQLAQQAAEAAALSAYRLYRTQLIERGMMALEADKAAREMALNVANSTFQQQMGRAQAVLNAPRGPADWGAYANRLRGLQQSGELPGVLGTLALPGRTATYSNGGESPAVPLTNTQFAEAATFGLTGGTPAAPTLYGPEWATQQLARQPYQPPPTFPAYFQNPTNDPSTLPPGYGNAAAAQGGLQALGAPSAGVQQFGMTSFSGQPQASAADLFGQAQTPADTWYTQMLNQMMSDPNQAMPGEPPIGPDEDQPVPGAGMTRREMRMAARQARNAQRRDGTPSPPQGGPYQPGGNGGFQPVTGGHPQSGPYQAPGGGQWSPAAGGRPQGGPYQGSGGDQFGSRTYTGAPQAGPYQGSGGSSWSQASGGRPQSGPYQAGGGQFAAQPYTGHQGGPYQPGALGQKGDPYQSVGGQFQQSGAGRPQGGPYQQGGGGFSPYAGGPQGGPYQASGADLFGTSAMSPASTQVYDGPVAADPNHRGLYGSDVSYQRFRNLSPTEQEMTVGYAEEGLGGFEPQSKDDFLSGMIKASPNYAPAHTATWAGIR